MEGKVERIAKGYKEYARKQGFRLNPDKRVVNGLIEGMLMNEKKFGGRYCPCRLVTGNKEKDKKIICPCIYHKDEIESMGHCHCGLFVR